MNFNLKYCIIFSITLILSACSTQSTPTSAPEKPAIPFSTISMDDRILASINTNEHPLTDQSLFGDNPEEIISAKDFIWIHLNNGYLVQVDPATNSMVSSIKTDTTKDSNHYCQGLGTDGKDIWVCSAAGEEDSKAINVVRVDTLTNRVVATFEVRKIWDQLYMPFAQNQIWVLTGSGEKLVGIDVINNQINPAIDLGSRCFHLSALDDILYVSCGGDNSIIKIDPRDNNVIARQTVQGPQFIHAAKNGVWVSQRNAITRLDPETLNPIVVITGITPSDIFVTETAVWAWEYGKGILYKIDPATNDVAELIKPDKPFNSGGGVLPTSDSLWLTVDENYLLLRLSLE